MATSPQKNPGAVMVECELCETEVEKSAASICTGCGAVIGSCCVEVDKGEDGYEVNDDDDGVYCVECAAEDDNDDENEDEGDEEDDLDGDLDDDENEDED